MPTITTTVTSAAASGVVTTQTITEASPEPAPPTANASVAAAAGFSTKPVLHYWNAAGRSEHIRVLWSAAGVEWDEEFYNTREEFLAKKPDLTYSQMPMVDVDGIQLVQQRPILRYVAKKTGFWPTCPAEEHLVDHIVEAYIDHREEAGGMLFIPFPEVWGGGNLKMNQHVIDKWQQDQVGASGLLVRTMPAWEKILTEGAVGIPASKAPGPFFLGDRPTVADICVFEFIDYWRFMNEVLMTENGLQGEACFELFRPFTKVMELYDAVLKIGNVHHWTREGRKRYDDFVEVRRNVGDALFGDRTALEDPPAGAAGL